MLQADESWEIAVLPDSVSDKLHEKHEVIKFFPVKFNRVDVAISELEKIQIIGIADNLFNYYVGDFVKNDNVAKGYKPYLVRAVFDNERGK